MSKSHKSRFRKIVVLNQEWKWKITQRGVLLKSPAGKSTEVDDSKIIKNDDFYSIERAKEKGYFSITPKMVADYIELNLI